jgi:hypothetical protein
MKRHGSNPIPSAAGFGNAVFASQPQKWLTERFGLSPQVCRFFDEKLPKLAHVNRNFRGFQRLTPLSC